MNEVHITVGSDAAHALQEAGKDNGQPVGEIFVLRDILHVGPLKTEGYSFSEGRAAFWHKISGETPEPVDDLERLMQLSTRLSNSENLHLYFWMAPWPADLCAYFWLLHYLRKHQGRFSVINIGGLPFIDGEGRLFYPDNCSRLPPKEVLKAQKLARVVSSAEWETDGAEWQRLREENADLRIWEGGKKLAAGNMDFYDDKLLSACSQQAQKASRVVNQAMHKNHIPTGDLFLLWRLETMAGDNQIILENGTVKCLPLSAENNHDNP